MGKPTGFIEFERATIPDRAPLERLKDWREIHDFTDFKQVSTQASRCMDCGVPYCHTGTTFGGMASGCPINNLIPEFNDLVYKNRWEEAFLRLKKTNNFPEFTGRVCPAPCEGSCVLGSLAPAVTIKNIECAIIDKAWDEGHMTPRPPKVCTGKKVAIVGSGPAGLAAADQLNAAGHAVTVFERADRPGGLLMYGIPNMKLDKQKVVLPRIKVMEEEGVTFKTNVHISQDSQWTPRRLREEFDAVLLCCGATKARDLVIEGRDAKGIYLAMDFLTSNTKHLLDNDFNHTLPALHAKGKDVIVIGGGDTGTDCVGTSLRQGANSVLQLEIMPKPPLQRADNNPWPEWPKIYKMDYGQEEAAALQGEDPRQYLVMTKSIIKDAQGKVEGLQVVNVAWEKDANGRFIPREVEGSIRVLPAQLVLLAMGFEGPEKGIIEQFHLDVDARGNVQADENLYKTNVEGVFVAGDMRRGQSLVVWAIKEGRGAARECDRYLMTDTHLP